MREALIIILISSILSSCTNYKKQNILFENYNFELPIEVKKAETLFDLTYGCYTGFYKGTPDEQLIGTQLSYYPLFMGSDNDTKESYYGNKFVGITFFKPLEIISFSQLKSRIEKQYNGEFQKRIEKKITKIEFMNEQMEFYQLKTETGLNVILKKIKRKLSNKEYNSVTFYPKMSDNKLVEYITWIQ